MLISTHRAASGSEAGFKYFISQREFYKLSAARTSRHETEFVCPAGLACGQSGKRITPDRSYCVAATAIRAYPFEAATAIHAYPLEAATGVDAFPLDAATAVDLFQ